MTNNEKALKMHEEWNGKIETTAKAHVKWIDRTDLPEKKGKEYDTRKI